MAAVEQIDDPDPVHYKGEKSIDKRLLLVEESRIASSRAAGAIFLCVKPDVFFRTVQNCNPPGPLQQCAHGEDVIRNRNSYYQAYVFIDMKICAMHLDGETVYSSG